MASREANGNDPPNFGMIFLKLMCGEHRGRIHGRTHGVRGWPAATNKRPHNGVAFSTIAIIQGVKSRFKVVNRREGKAGSDRQKFFINYFFLLSERTVHAKIRQTDKSGQLHVSHAWDSSSLTL